MALLMKWPMVLVIIANLRSFYVHRLFCSNSSVSPITTSPLKMPFILCRRRQIRRIFKFVPSSHSLFIWLLACTWTLQAIINEVTSIDFGHSEILSKSRNFFYSRYIKWKANNKKAICDSHSFLYLCGLLIYWAGMIESIGVDGFCVYFAVETMIGARGQWHFKLTMIFEYCVSNSIFGNGQLMDSEVGMLFIL